MREITIAAACIQSKAGDLEGNLERLGRAARDAAEAGAEMVVLPEACLTGYSVGPDASSAAIRLDDPAMGKAADLAQETGAALVIGLIERADESRLFLTQVVFDPSRRMIGRYRKLHLGPTEQEQFTPGSDLGLFDLNGARFGLQLCFDGHFPELATLQALGGAEIILVSHASPRNEEPGEKRDRWLRYLPARAYDNTAFLVACNPVGDNGQGVEFAGVALIIGPKGEVLADYAGSAPGHALAKLDGQMLEKIRASRMGFFRAFRRPELYKGLVD